MLTGTPLGPTGGFNWVQLVDLLVCGILAIFFLFYFNRLFGTVVSYGIRAWTWHKYRAYVDITALQISLLGGRIFFKGIRYHAHNITVFVHDGHITWRYWLRAVEQAEVFQSRETRDRDTRSSEGDEADNATAHGSRFRPRSASVGNAEQAQKPVPRELPCRLSIRVAGVEAFVYNRSPAYDSVLEAAIRRANGSNTRTSSESNDATSPSSSPGAEKKDQATAGQFNSQFSRPNSQRTTCVPGDVASPELPAWLTVLPIHVECKKAAAAVGNQHTTSILTAKLERAQGTVDAGHAGTLDIFKLLFNFDFEKLQVAMKPNRDYKQPQSQYAKQKLRDQQKTGDQSESVVGVKIERSWTRPLNWLRKSNGSSASLRAASPKSTNEKPFDARYEPLPGNAQWRGLNRYLDDSGMLDKDEWEGVEYARSSTLADCEKVSFRFYWDIPGKVPDDDAPAAQTARLTPEDDINGTSPPAYGMDFGVYEGFLCYGPWADRQRANLQHVFFPASYVDADPAEQLKPGQYRVSTIFKIYVSLEEDVVLRIPTRESSKDDRWHSQTQRNTSVHPDAKPDNNASRSSDEHPNLKTGPASSDARPYGWLDITVKADTTVNYTMDMFASREGFRNILDLDVKGTTMESSVNHALLWRAGALKMKADLSNPVAWNTLREWPFSITCDDLELFILRDHMFLIIDLVNDWSSGSSPNFYTFVSFFYKLDMTFNNFKLYLNVNDANIINDPANLDKNEFLTLEGDKLRGELGIPLEHYRAERSGVTFDVVAEMMRMRLLSSSRSTLSTLMKDKQVADLPKFTLCGSYSGHSQPVVGSTDLLRMDLAGSGLNLTAYGFLIRQFINIKENYFGDYVHFKTLEEFQIAGNTFEEANENTAAVAKPQSVSELDVVLCIVADDATIKFPTSLYSANEYVKAEVPLASLDLRIVSYYLDMGLNISPISLASELINPSSSGSPLDSETGTQLWISHVDLDGHRAFGVGLGEPAYACTWDIDIGTIMGQCSKQFIRDLALVSSTFTFAFADAENVLPLSSPSVFYDATFVRLNTDDIRIWLSFGDDAMLVQAAPISLQTNDLADDMFSQRISILAPLLTLACVDGQDATRRHVTPNPIGSIETLAFLQTGVSIDIVVRKASFEVERLKQQVHIRQHDQRTERAPFLVRATSQTDVASLEFSPQAMPCPPLPYPVHEREAKARRSRHRLKQRSSTASLSASIRHGREAALGQETFGDARMEESLRGKVDRQQAKPTPTPTMTFTNSYSVPRYTFQDFSPDESKVPAFPPCASPDGGLSSSSTLELFEVSSATDETVAHTTIIIKVIPGIRAYVEPRIAHSLAAMVSDLQPRTLEQVMDAFQMRVLGKIAQQQRARQGQASVLEILADVPVLQARLGTPQSAVPAVDELNLVAGSLRSNIRIHTRPSESGEASNTVATHNVINSFELTLDECRNPKERSSAARLALGDVLFWVGIDAVKSVHLSVQDCSLAIAGEKASYLSTLVLRMVPLVQSGIQEFANISESEHGQLLSLISGLVQHSEGQLDPPFLSRMTYILRAFPAHFRNQESWKVLARFRYIMSLLSDEELVQLAGEGQKISPDSAEAHSKVLTSWAQWRNWDVPDVSQTVAFRTLLGMEDQTTGELTDTKALNVTTRVDLLRIGLGGRKKVSELIIQDTSIGLDSAPPKMPTGLMLVEENKRRYTQLQMHTTRIALLVDWSLYGIAEEVVSYLPRFEALKTAHKSSAERRSAAQILEEGLDRHDFHVVLSTDDGNFEVQSVNLQYTSRAENLKLSLIGTTQLNELYGPCASALLNVSKATTELRARGNCIWQTRLWSPSLYIDHRQATKRGHLNPLVTLAAAYDELRVEVKEQPLGILHVVDTVMIDEVATMIKLVRSVQSMRIDAKPPTTAKADSNALSTHFNIAMLAGKLHMDVALLQTLAYRLEGTAASVRIEPNLAGGKLFDVDFDIGRQFHSFVNRQGGETFNQGILQLPPVNGQVEFDLRGEHDFFSIAMTIEQTEIEAAAIHGLMTVLERPEVQSMISAIDNGVQDIRHHLQELNLTVAPEKTKSSAPSRSVVYDVRFALLGVAVTAATSRGADGSRARMTFGIGPMHAKASNRDTPAESNPWVPAVRAQIQDIGARLWLNNNGKDKSCGRISLDLEIRFDSQWTGKSVARDLKVRSGAILADVYPESASTAVIIINHLQDKIRGLDLSQEIEYLRHLRDTRKHRVTWKRISSSDAEKDYDLAFSAAELLSTTTTTLELNDIQVVWHVADAFAPFPNASLEDAILTLKKVELTTKGGNEARLTIVDLMLQLSQADQLGSKRARNSALLSEVGFSVTYWTEGKERRLAFRAAGQPLEIHLDAGFLVPLSGVQRSINSAIDGFQAGTADWQTASTSDTPRANIFDTKHLASLLVEADFAGAKVHMQGSARGHPAMSATSPTQQGRYGQFSAEDGLVHTSLQTPGIALKLEYNSANRQPTVHGELRVDASSNMLLPNVVPLMLEISNSIKQIVQSQDKPAASKPEPKVAPKYFEEDSIITANPAAIFGKTEVDLGLRICRQEFGLSCQPIARVDANAALDDFYLTVNTIDSAEEYGHFFAVSAVVSKLTAQVKHAYSREPTLSYDMESVTLSLMNSKHVSGISGVSAILKFDPIKLFVNGKQLQDLLLFREIWLPPEIRSGQTATNETSSGRPEDYLVQRYQMTAAAAAFPWNATVSVTKVEMDLDLGRSIGKSSFMISNLWASQQKSSNWEQNLCVGLDEVAITSTGRMSGFLLLSKLGIRMSIKWPQEDLESPRTPLIQASIGFSRLKAKAAFDYQAFAFGDIEGFDFLMYNVRHSHPTAAMVDRLVGVLDCEKAYVFITSTSAAQAVALYQAFDRLVQERQLAYAQSLKEIEKHLKREHTPTEAQLDSPASKTSEVMEFSGESPFSLHTDVVVTLGAVSFGVFPSTFFDSQLLKLEASSVQSRFAVGMENGKIHSGLGITIGQLQVALAGVRRMTTVPKSLDISVDEVITSAVNSKGGTILRVPKVVASMQTWQIPREDHVDYVFKSLFDGKIDVGWNLSRINFIQSMWTSHARALASRLGKALPESAVKITAAVTEAAGDQQEGAQQQEKIRAEVSLPQFRYRYQALEPPIIETPQLRDMGEATPPLEWIGLNRDRLPNVTHQILIVSLLKIAKEVEDAYERVLAMRA